MTTETEPCPTCNGTGTIGDLVSNLRFDHGTIRGNCDRCSGTGVLETTQ